MTLEYKVTGFMSILSVFELIMTLVLFGVTDDDL